MIISKKSALLALLLLPAVRAAEPSYAEKAIGLVYWCGTKIKGGANHICSTAGAKDLVAAYALGMGLTTIHELGHAVTAKALYGHPIDITIGKEYSPDQDSTPPLAQFGGFKLRGFMPGVAYNKLAISISDNSPLKNIAVALAGPVCGYAASITAYQLLKNYAPNYCVTRGTALFFLFAQTVSGWHPGGDEYQIVQYIRQYNNQQS